MTAATEHLDAAGIRFAYRRLGPKEGVPLLFLQHFTGTMDNWDPEVTDGFARKRPVILFDNVGVGGSTGTTPRSMHAMAGHAATFVASLGLTQVDLLGFSLGGFIAQVLAAEHPALARRLILVGTGPEGGAGIAQLGNVVAGGQKLNPGEPRLPLFFDVTEHSQSLGREFLSRQSARTVDRAPDAKAETVDAQLEAITRWGDSPGPEAATRLQGIRQPVWIVNGKNDVVVPTMNSYALFQQLPDARLTLYPDSGHGALFQFSGAFVREGLDFLD